MAETGKVMIVDDSVTVLDLAKAKLSAEGFRVVTTSNPSQAARLLAGCHLVLIDFHMPGTNGEEVCARLRKAVPEGESPLFFLYTTDAKASTNYLSRGFDGVFVLKGNADSLLRQVKAAMRLAAIRAVK
ncbi:MAG: response regulator [Myxococcales bacterium]|jgi:CheY-like chemotaxis protein